jgi:hypoxanthine phosphoribosyltransferase
MKKYFLDEESVIRDSFRIGVQVFESGFKPTFIVGLWRGGSPVGIYVQECLQTLGIKTNHISVRTSYSGMPAYQNMIDAPKEIRVHGTQYLIENLNAEDSLLIVDDVFSTGYNIQAVITRLQRAMKRNYPQQVKVATLWQRPKYRKTDAAPDYCLHETDDWLVFPYELKGLTPAEIEQHKPLAAPLLQKMHTGTDAS